MTVTEEQREAALAALRYHQTTQLDLQQEATNLRIKLADHVKAVEDRLAGLERAARTAAQQEAELQAWLEAADGPPPHVGEVAKAAAANGGVMRRHSADEDGSEAEYYSDGLEGEAHEEHTALPVTAAAAGSGRHLESAASADSPPPGTLPAKYAAASAPWAAPPQPPAQSALLSASQAAGASVPSESAVAAAADDGRAPAVDAAAQPQGAAAGQPQREALEREAPAEELPAEPPLGFMPRPVALQGGPGSATSSGGSPRGGARLEPRAPRGVNMFAAAFAGVARDRKLPLRGPGSRASTASASVAGDPPATSDTDGTAAGGGTTNPAHPGGDAWQARPQQGGGMDGHGPPGFGAAAGGDAHPAASPPGLRQRPGPQRVPPGFDAPPSAPRRSQHDDRFEERTAPAAGAASAPSPPPGFGGRTGYGGHGGGARVNGDVRGVQQQQQQQRRHPAEGLRPPMRDAMGHVMGVSSRASAAYPHSAVSNGSAPPMAAPSAAPQPMRDAMGNVMGVSRRAPAAPSGTSLSAAAAYPPSGYAQLPSTPSQQDQAPLPPLSSPPPGLAQQHAALLPPAAAAEDTLQQRQQLVGQRPGRPLSAGAPEFAAPQRNGSVAGSTAAAANGHSVQSMEGVSPPSSSAAGSGSGGGSTKSGSPSLDGSGMNGSAGAAAAAGAQLHVRAHGSTAACSDASMERLPSAMEDGMEPDLEAEGSPRGQRDMPPGALPVPAMAQAHNITHDPFDGAEGQRPASAASGGSAKRSWADEFYEDAPQLPPLPAADDFPTLGGGASSSAVGGAWGNASRLKSSLAEEGAKGMTRLAPAAAGRLPPPPTEAEVIAVEHAAKLRLPGDNASDIERRKQVEAMRDFFGEEVIRGRRVNVLAGLELHKQLLSREEEQNMIEHVRSWVAAGRRGELRGRTFSAPRKWMPGKGRITCQFGCCYNYAIDAQGRPKGIIAEEVVEPLPAVLKALCKRLVRWRILPRNREPDTAIVNVYDTGDCIPPHIDHHDFVRPFVTVSLQSKQEILFSEKIVALDAGVFSGKFKMPLPPGSCLVLKGNGADVAQHCIPPVSQPRMSITLRCMAPNHAARVAAEAKAVLEGGGAFINGRGDRSTDTRDLPRAPRAWLTGGEAEPDRSGIDGDRWTSMVPDNDGWGNVKITAAKPRRK